MENNSKQKIFVIEDNKTESMLLKLSMASVKNITITNFTFGHELLSHMDENPDIVIVDMMLPDITGEEVIQAIRQEKPDTEIIVVSAQKDIDLIARVQELNVFNYIVKSEACMGYLQRVIENLLFLIRHKQLNHQ